MMAPAAGGLSACSSRLEGGDNSCFWLRSNSHMSLTYNGKLPLTKCGLVATRLYQTVQVLPENRLKLPLRCSRQPNLLCFWFQCCSLSFADQSPWLITRPIAASGQSQALYDSTQTTDRGAHSAILVFAHIRRGVGSIMFADCIGYCCVQL